jgi:hypothetical protein
MSQKKLQRCYGSEVYVEFRSRQIFGTISGGVRQAIPSNFAM